MPEGTTLKSQNEAEPKLKTPLQPTKVAEFEGQDNQTKGVTDEETEVTEQRPHSESNPEADPADTTEPGDSVAETDAESVAKAKHELRLQPRYSHLSEEDVRSRTHSEMSETSEDRVKFMLGETESESGSHLDLKGE